MTEETPWVKEVLDYYELTHQDEKIRRLKALLAAKQVRAGPMQSAYGTHVVVDSVDENVFIYRFSPGSGLPPDKIPNPPELLVE